MAHWLCGRSAVREKFRKDMTTIKLILILLFLAAVVWSQYLEQVEKSKRRKQ